MFISHEGKKPCLVYVISLLLSGDINTSAILHLASSVPSQLQFTSTDFNSYNTVKTGEILRGSSGSDFGGLKDGKGKMGVPTGVGLGVKPNFEVLGEPVFSVE